MITINLGRIEYFDSKANEFVYEDGGIVRFEYTLKMIYDWESKWKKPFLKGGLTNEESVDFYKRMALDPIKESFLTVDVIEVLANYIKESNTATTFTNFEEGQASNKTNTAGKIYTAEELYAMMFSAGVPLEFENRNVNRLIVILKIISSYNNPPKKMSKQDIFRQNAKLNAQRKAKMKTKG